MRYATFAITILSLLVSLVAVAVDSAIQERIEWSDIWVVNADTDDHPRVLLVGDSIVRGYYDGVEKALGDKVNLARYTSSKFLGDPDYLPELGLLLHRYDFDVVHINNGLHGFGYTEAQYQESLRELMEFLAKEVPNAKVIWAMSTPIRDTADLEKVNADKNDRVIERNRIAAEIMKSLGVTINDLYTPVADHPDLFSNDGVHFNDQGRELLATQVAKALQAVLAK